MLRSRSRASTRRSARPAASAPRSASTTPSPWWARGPWSSRSYVTAAAVAPWSARKARSREEPHAIGVLEAGTAARDIPFAHGVLNVGEPMATPAIRQLKRWAIPADGPDGSVVILDAPPGTSCPGGRSRARGRFPAAGHRADPLRAARSATGRRGRSRAGHAGRRGDQPRRHRRRRCGRVLRDRGIADPAAHPLGAAIAEAIAQGRTLVEIHPEYAARFRALYAEVGRSVRGTP